jgi:hypothetical protein
MPPRGRKHYEKVSSPWSSEFTLGSGLQTGEFHCIIAKAKRGRSLVGYETEVFLVDQGYNGLFADWHLVSEHWYTKDLNPLDQMADALDPEDRPGHKNELLDLPHDALLSDCGTVVARIKLGKIGRDEGLSEFFRKNREQQKTEKKYPLIVWNMCHVHGDERPDLTDPYGDPYAIHDAKETLKELRAELASGEWDDMADGHNLRMLEAMLSVFVKGKRFKYGVVVTRGY